MMPMTRQHDDRRRRSTCDASGNSGRQSRIMPKVPTLSSTPTSSTAAPGGASAAASGSQVCNGHSGALIAKAKKKPRNSSFSRAGVDVEAGQVVESRKPWSPPAAGRRRAPMTRDQHEQAAEQAVEQELHRGVRALRRRRRRRSGSRPGSASPRRRRRTGRRRWRRRRRPSSSRARAAARRSSARGAAPSSDVVPRREDARPGRGSAASAISTQRDAVDADGVADAELRDPAGGSR